MGILESLGNFSNGGGDFGGLTSQLFGDNDVSKSLGSILDFGSNIVGTELLGSIKADEMKQKRADTTRTMNAQYNPSIGKPIDIEGNFKKYGIYIVGAIGAFLLLAFSMSRGK